MRLKQFLEPLTMIRSRNIFFEIFLFGALFYATLLFEVVKATLESLQKIIGFGVQVTESDRIDASN